MSKTLQLFAAAILLWTPLTGQQLLQDFNSAPQTEAASSSPRPVAVATNGQAVLAATQPAFGEELFVTDGTAQGTSLLRDIHQGIGPSKTRYFVTLPSGLILFRAKTAAEGYELWRTDGTPQGTAMVRDIWPGNRSAGPSELVVLGSEAVFLADDGVSGTKLWRSDGTSSGTLPVATPSTLQLSSSTRFHALNSTEILFGAETNANTVELWRSDLTPSGTTLVKTLPTQLTFQLPHSFTSLSNGLVFYASNATATWELWFSDGTASGTTRLAAAGSVLPFIQNPPVVAGGLAYFAGISESVWTTDGTAAGTQQLIAPSGTGTRSPPIFLGVAGNAALFAAGPTGNRQTYSSTGTLQATQSIAPLDSLFDYGRNRSAVLPSGDLLFNGVTASGERQLWRTDGTPAGTSLIHPYSAEYLLPYQNGVLMAAEHPATGNEIWFTDGTPTGTNLVADLAAMQMTLGSRPWLLTAHRDEMVFAADFNDRRATWISDGTSAGTREITPPDNASVRWAASTGDKLIVFTQTEVWRYDDVNGALVPLQVRTAHQDFRFDTSWQGSSAQVGDRIVFTGHTAAHGREPWVTDGTLAGTKRLVDLWAGPIGSTFNGFTTWNNMGFFFGRSPFSNKEPYVTDGTPAGTIKLVETAPGSGGVGSATWQATDDALYIRAVPGPYTTTLWRTDGTVAGTSQVDLAAVGLANPKAMASLGDRLLTIASNGTNDVLVVTDGSAQGTTTLPVQNPDELFPFDSRRALANVKYGPQRGTWITDGTAAGTMFLGILDPPSEPLSTRTAMTTRICQNSGLITDNDPVVGQEIKVSDGTPAGTRLLFDLAPGDAEVTQVLRAGQTVFFTANDGVHGDEVFVFDVALLEDGIVERFGFGCATATGSPPTIELEGAANASTPIIQVVVEATQPSTPVLISIAPPAPPIPLPRCTLWVGGPGTVSVAALSNAQGRAALPLNLNPSLFGLRFVAQGFAVEANGPVLGFLTASEGLEVILGL